MLGRDGVDVLLLDIVPFLGEGHVAILYLGHFCVFGLFGRLSFLLFELQPVLLLEFRIHFLEFLYFEFIALLVVLCLFPLENAGVELLEDDKDLDHEDRHDQPKE